MSDKKKSLHVPGIIPVVVIVVIGVIVSVSILSDSFAPKPVTITTTQTVNITTTKLLCANQIYQSGNQSYTIQNCPNGAQSAVPVISGFFLGFDNGTVLILAMLFVLTIIGLGLWGRNNY